MDINYIDFFEYHNLEDRPSLYLALGFTLALFLSVPVLVWALVTGNFDIRPSAKVAQEGLYQAPPAEVTQLKIEGDVNADGKVDIYDYNALIGNFGRGDKKR